MPLRKTFPDLRLYEADENGWPILALECASAGDAQTMVATLTRAIAGKPSGRNGLDVVLAKSRVRWTLTIQPINGGAIMVGDIVPDLVESFRAIFDDKRRYYITAFSGGKLDTRLECVSKSKIKFVGG